MPSPIRLTEQLWQQREATKSARATQDAAASVIPGIKFVDDSMPEQAAYIRDPARMKLAFCTRRAGKSYGDGRYLCQEAAAAPNVSCLYIALTRESAENTMWRDVLKVLDRELGLNGSFNETKLRMRLPNGSTIRLLGLDASEDEKKKLLGGKYRLVVIDEAASFTIDLHALIYEVLKPAVADHDGIICLSSTPTNIHAGMFFEMTKDHDSMTPGVWTYEDWSCHRWSYEQNPYMRRKVERDIGELIAKKPHIEETPGFQQHWRGRWAIDLSKLVYKYLASRNSFSGSLPQFRSGRWHYLLGIDTGWKASAFTLTAYHDHSPDLFVLESWKRRAMDITAMADVVKWYRDNFDIEQEVVDGANKQAVQEMNRRHGLSLQAADKKDKFEFIDIMNDDFIQRRIFVSAARWETERAGPFLDEARAGAPEYVTKFKCGLLVGEYATLVLDERKLLKARKRDEHPNLENHCCDSALYPWRLAYPYLSTQLKPAPAATGTPEFVQELARQQEAAFEAEQEAEFRRNREAESHSDAPDDWT